MSGWTRRTGLQTIILVVVLGWGASLHGQMGNYLRIPAVQGTSFSGQAVTLPKDLQGKVGVLVVGFTQGSRDAVKSWGVRLAADYSNSTAVAYYEMPVLAGVPRLLRSYVTGKIKESVSEPARPHFLPITENEAAWRAVTSCKSGDDAYVLLVDGQGVVRWQSHGAANEDMYRRLKEQTKELAAASVHASDRASQ